MVFAASGIARPSAFVFCFLEGPRVFPLSFLFFSELAMAHSRRRLTGAALLSASSCGSMSESVIDKPDGADGAGYCVADGGALDPCAPRLVIGWGLGFMRRSD